MKHKNKKIIIWTVSVLFGLPIVSFVGFLLFFSYMIGMFKEHPSDEILAAQLSENKPRYEQLITMFKADHPLTVVAPTWQSPDGHLSEKRWNEYRNIFEELDLDMGIRKWKSESIRFINSSRGMATGGDSKGLIFKPVDPEPIYSTLNERPSNLKSGVRGYKKINENWYITFDWHS